MRYVTLTLTRSECDTVITALRLRATQGNDSAPGWHDALWRAAALAERVAEAKRREEENWRGGR